VFAASAAPWAAEAAVFLAVPVLFLAVPVLFLAADFPGAGFLAAAAAFFAVVFLAAGFLADAFGDAVFRDSVFGDADFVAVVFKDVASAVAGAVRAFFFPPSFLAAALVDLPDADCCTAVFATMAATPSHIVILLANRAGTINRLLARGNGARPRFARPASPARRVCMRCAQLPAG
jgi:hypothetical protein